MEASGPVHSSLFFKDDSDETLGVQKFYKNLLFCYVLIIDVMLIISETC